KYGDQKKAVPGKELVQPLDPYKGPPGKFQFDGKGFGEWNSLTLTSKNGNLEIVVNGKHAITLGDCDPSEGFLGLQVDGRETHLANVQIQELPPPEPVFQPLFNGKDLDGWVGDAKVWKAEGKALIFHGKYMSPLRTGKTYENYILRFEHWVEPDGSEKPTL